MNSPSTDTDIPTLTDMIQAGDPDMKNHFDAHMFDDVDGEHDRPAPLSAISDDMRETVELLVQDVLNEQLATIEEQLKQQLTRSVLDKLAQRRKR